MACKCGCGEATRGSRKFVSKEHQITWMLNGGGREMGALQPIEARRQAGVTSGNRPENKHRLEVLRPYANERARQMEAQARAKFDPRADS